MSHHGCRSRTATVTTVPGAWLANEVPPTSWLNHILPAPGLRHRAVLADPDEAHMPGSGCRGLRRWLW